MQTIGDLPRGVQTGIGFVSLLMTVVICFALHISIVAWIAWLLVWAFCGWTVGGLYMLFSGFSVKGGLYHSAVSMLIIVLCVWIFG